MSHTAPKFAFCILVVTSMAVGQPTTAQDSEAVQDSAAEISPDAMQKAQALQRQERWVEAADLFMQITEAQPDNGPAWFNLGYCLHMAGELDLALNAHRKAATFEDFTGIALYNLGCAYALLGEADESFEALAASHQAGFNVYGNLDSDSDLESLHEDERFESFRAKIAPQGPAAKIEQGGQSVKDMLMKARQYLEQNGPALMQQAKMMAQQAAGMAQQKIHELQEMASDDEQVAELRARLHESFARAHEAFLQWRQRSNPEVDQEVLQVVEDSDDPQAMMAAAQQFFQRGQWSEAVEAYRGVVEIDPENGPAWFNLGYSLLADGQLDEAIEVNRRTSEFEAFKGIAFYNLACGHSLKGDTDAAFEALEKCREAGFDRLPGMVDDSDFDNIRDDERYAEFLASLEDQDA